MMRCPICGKEMIWMNDWDDGEDDTETYTDYNCYCGTAMTVPWNPKLEDDDGD